MCFVIQPFDSGGKFDKRFKDLLKPALAEAGLEVYRVDQDPSVDIPIKSIESQIQKATICLADITDNNPNVWYELGFAFALGYENYQVTTVSSEGWDWLESNDSLLTMRRIKDGREDGIPF